MSLNPTVAGIYTFSNIRMEFNINVIVECWQDVFSVSYLQKKEIKTNTIGSRNNEQTEELIKVERLWGYSNLQNLKSWSGVIYFWQAAAMHRQGHVSDIHHTLFILHPGSCITEPSLEFFPASQRGDRCQTGLSCLPLASFQLDFTISFPPGLLLVSRRPPMSRCEDDLPGARCDSNLLCP